VTSNKAKSFLLQRPAVRSQKMRVKTFSDARKTDRRYAMSLSTQYTELAYGKANSREGNEKIIRGGSETKKITTHQRDSKIAAALKTLSHDLIQQS
jgi:hypothetical protein